MRQSLTTETSKSMHQFSAIRNSISLMTPLNSLCSIEPGPPRLMDRTCYHPGGKFHDVSNLSYSKTRRIPPGFCGETAVLLLETLFCPLGTQMVYMPPSKGIILIQGMCALYMLKLVLLYFLHRNLFSFLQGNNVVF